MKSNWDNDFLLEKQLGIFLDNKFYPWLVKNNNAFLDWKRIKDKNLQLEGKDVKLYMYNNDTDENVINYIDEKSTSHYLNQRIPTFALELSTLNTTDMTINDGWLIDSTKKTDYYFFIWPDIKGWKYNKLCEEEGLKQYNWQNKIYSNHFSSMEIWIVLKSELIDLLQQENLSLEDLRHISTTIRENWRDDNFNPTQYDKMEKNNERYNFNYSTHLAEKPINLILRKNVMKNIARKFLIFEDYVIDLDNDIKL